MPDLYLGIANQTANILSRETNEILPNIQYFTDFYRRLYDATADRADISIMSRSIEFYSYAIVGAPGGETLAPMIWATTQFPAFIASMIKAESGFIIDGPAALLFFSDSVQQVYTANTTALGLSVENIDTSSVNNVETLTWNQIRSEMSQVDMVSCYLNALVDYDILDSLVDSVKPGGVFLLRNASNGSQLYHSENSFPEEVHNRIKDRGDFYSFHMQGYISDTCFIKEES
jgi:hypothetical protein